MYFLISSLKMSARNLCCVSPGWHHRQNLYEIKQKLWHVGKKKIKHIYVTRSLLGQKEGDIFLILDSSLIPVHPYSHPCPLMLSFYQLTY